MEKLKFEPLSIQRASAHIEKTIKEAILARTLKTGDKLSTEKEMASQFGVSLVTLREALRALEISGLIIRRKGQKRGIFVSEIDNESIKASLVHFLNFKDLSSRHLYEVRKIIEPSAIKLAAHKITLDGINKLEENVFYCEERLRNLGDILNEQEFFDLDQENNVFHKIIAESTHNPILSLTIDYVLDFLPEFETKILVPDIHYCKDNVMDHRNILESIKEKDGEKCAERMLFHLDRLDEYLKKMKIDLSQWKSGERKGTEG